VRARAELEATAKELFDVIAKGVVAVRVVQSFALLAAAVNLARIARLCVANCVISAW